MRKVLSLVLVLALVLGSFSMAFASYSDMAGEDSSDAVNVLSALGVIAGYPDGTFGPDKIVTRAEMAKLIVAALGLSDYATGTSSKYSDMAGHWANGFVAYATSLGIITGYPDGTFKPEMTVTYEEACAMIVRALGYTAEFLPGGWPAEWVIKAKTLGILDDVDSAMGGANRGDIAMMLFNALTAYIGYINNDGDWVPYGEYVYNYDRPDIHLVPRSGIQIDYDSEMYLGQVEYDGPEMYFDGDTMLKRLGAEYEGFDIIEGDEDTIINLRAYVGAYAETYTLDGDIIVVIPDSIFLTGEYDGDGTFEADNGTDYIVPSELEYDYAFHFFNGEINWYDYSIEEFTDMTTTIAVDISGRTIKDIYSISEWYITQDFVVDEDVLDEFADDETMYGETFMMDDDDEVDMMSFEILGADSLGDIEEDDVVYLYVSDYSPAQMDVIRRIEVGTEIVTGDITKIASGEITVDGTVYEFAGNEMYLPNFELNYLDDFELGDNVTLTLDYHGYIYTLDNNEEASGGNYAVMLETEDGNSVGTLSDPATDGLVKLFLADGTDKVFSVDGDLDNEIIETGSFNTGYIGTSGAGMIVEYGLDDDGVIDFIEVVETDHPDGVADVTSKGYYDGTPIASAAVIFTFTGTTYAAIEDAADEENYDVIEKDDIVGVDDVAAVYFEEDNSIKVMMIFEIDDVTTSDDMYGVVIDWFESTASDTDYVITMLVDGEEVDYDADEDLYMDIGDYYGLGELYILDMNAAGELVGLVFAIDEWIAEFYIADYANGAVYDSEDHDGDKVTVDSGAMIYYYDDPFEVVSMTRTNLEGYYGYMYDLDEDGVADLILTEDATK